MIPIDDGPVAILPTVSVSRAACKDVEIWVVSGPVWSTWTMAGLSTTADGVESWKLSTVVPMILPLIAAATASTSLGSSVPQGIQSSLPRLAVRHC